MLQAPDLIQRRLGDVTVQDILVSWYGRDAPEALLWRAAELFEGASPAMIMNAARWLGVLEDLRTKGLEDRDIARLLLSAASGVPKGWVPDGNVLSHVLEAATGVEDATVLAKEVLAAPAPPAIAAKLITIFAAILARAGRAVPETFDVWLAFGVPWRTLRDVIESLPEERRDAVLVRLVGKPTNDNGARVQLRYLLPVLDLATGTGAKQALARLRGLLEGRAQWAELLAAADAGGGPPPPREGATQECRVAVQYWVEKYEAARRRDAIGGVAREAHARAIRIDAPELTSSTTWREAAQERREAIARGVANAVPGTTFDGFEERDAGPIARFTHGGLPFRLVAGGSFVRGFSAEEESLVREVAESKRAADDNWFEEYGSFLDRILPWLRPVATVHVGPLLACATAGHRMAPGDVTTFLQSSPFRLPSEAEWEYLARGGVQGELTWRGHVVPDEAWFQETVSGGAALANRFGLWGFGIEPELCADAWHDTYAGAPLDGGPWWDEGSRVTRGGAGMLHPWQQVGEWQLLCSAMRSRAHNWEFELAVRPVIGLVLG